MQTFFFIPFLLILVMFIYIYIERERERDNYTKNPDLLLFCRKSHHFSFLQNWTLTFQFPAK